MYPDSRPTSRHAPEHRVAVVCPQCKQGYKIAGRLLGRKLTCKKCRREWRAEEASQQEIRDSRIRRGDQPSASGQVNFEADLPPTAGSSSVSIDMSWAGRRIGRYRARSLLGYGGMGVVWRAHDSNLRRDVALKILDRKRGDGPKAGLNLDLFMQEARAVAKLQHPAVVAIYEVNEDRGHAFLALELMEGGTLKEYVDRYGPIEPKKLFHWMIGPAKALYLAHERRIIHRDIKPGNLMFDDHGHLKLMDFGLADVSQEEVSEKLRGKAVGSLGWVAPETAKGEVTTHLSDIYSFGLVLHYALTGRPLIHAKSRSAMIKMHRSPPPVRLDGIRGLTAQGRRLIQRCLEVDASRRFASARELATALERCAAEDPKADRQQRTSRIFVGVSAALIGAIVTAGAGLYKMVELRKEEERLGQPSARRVRPAAPLPIDASEPARKTPRQSEFLNKPPELQDTDDPKTYADSRVPWPEVIDGAGLKYIASRHGAVFHRPDGLCGARKIYAANLLVFETYADAEKAGLKPCSQCRPEPDKPAVVQAPGDGTLD